MFSELFSWVEDQSLWRGLDWKLLGSRLDAPDLCVSAGSGWHCALFSVCLLYTSDAADEHRDV